MEHFKGKSLRRIRIAFPHQTRPDRHADTPTLNTPLVMPLLFVVVVGRCASHLPSYL